MFTLFARMSCTTPSYWLICDRVDQLELEGDFRALRAAGTWKNAYILRSLSIWIRFFLILMRFLQRGSVWQCLEAIDKEGGTREEVREVNELWSWGFDSRNCDLAKAVVALVGYAGLAALRMKRLASVKMKSLNAMGSTIQQYYIDPIRMWNAAVSLKFDHRLKNAKWNSRKPPFVWVYTIWTRKLHLCPRPVQYRLIGLIWSDQQINPPQHSMTPEAHQIQGSEKDTKTQDTKCS